MLGQYFKIVIIGAGASGLAACKYALQYGIKSVIILQKCQDVGGLWNPKSGSTWKNMTTNVSHHNCAFTDYPWPQGTPVFPLAYQLYEYMKAYSNHFGVSSYIQFNSRATGVEKLQNGHFKVTWEKQQKDEKKSMTVTAENVIVGSGMFEEPNRDYSFLIPGLNQFKGQILHSADYRSIQPFQGKRVLTVGGSISGVDISGDLAKSAALVIHQFNKPFFVLTHFLNALVKKIGNQEEKIMRKVPADLMNKSRAHLLSSSQNLTYEEKVRQKNQKIAKLCSKQQIMEEIGFTSEDFNRVMYICISSNYLKAVQQKKVRPKKSGIQKFTQNSIVFKDGSEQKIDAVIMCTGFKNPLNFLSEELKKLIQYDEIDNRQTGILYNNILHPQIPNLFFLGHYKGNVVPAVEIQAKYVLKLITKQCQLPLAKQIQSQMEEQRKVRNLKDKPQSINHNHVPYADKLSLQMGQKMDLMELKQKNFEVFKKFVALPSVHNHRAFSLENLETNMREIQELLNSLEEVKEEKK